MCLLTNNSSQCTHTFFSFQKVYEKARIYLTDPCPRSKIKVHIFLSDYGALQSAELAVALTL